MKPSSSTPLTPEEAFRQAQGLHRAGRLAEAEQVYRRILEAVPDHADSLHFLGLCRHMAGDPAAAESLIRQALALRPGNAEACLNLGAALKALGRPGEALASLDRALALQPGQPAAWINRGNLLAGLGRLDEALASFDRALALRPDHANAHYNRARTLEALHRPGEALASYDQAVRHAPDHAAAHGNRGNVLRKLGRAREALASYDQALRLRPDSADTLSNRAAALFDLGRQEEALACYERMFALDPDQPRALGIWTYLRMRLCQWADQEGDLARLWAAIRDGRAAVNPFMLLATPWPGARHLECARRYALDHHPADPSPLWRGERYGHARIRVGYFSADYVNHPLAHLMSGLFERHDRARFETYAFSFGPPSDHPARRRLEAAFDHFLDVRGRSDAEIAALARELEIDIAVDLNGYTQDCRPGIFARRPAPAQVSYLGYVGTLGADWMDYIVADGTVIPPEHEAWYSEKVVRLPHTYQVNDSALAIADRAFTRAELGLPEAGFVFCCFSNSYKISPDAFDVWMRLLRSVEGSVLWLFEADPAAARNLREEARRRGVEPGRLIFAPYMELAMHLARHRQADLFLDTFHYNAGATASHALWAGLPVLTRLGDSFAGRMAASLLRAIGLPELVAATTAEYEALALELATDPERLAAIRARLAANRLTEPLFDTTLFTRHIEAAYVRMWQRAEAGLPAQSMEIGAMDGQP